MNYRLTKEEEEELVVFNKAENAIKTEKFAHNFNSACEALEKSTKFIKYKESGEKFEAILADYNILQINLAKIKMSHTKDQEVFKEAKKDVENAKHIVDKSREVYKTNSKKMYKTSEWEEYVYASSIYTSEVWKKASEIKDDRESGVEKKAEK